LIDIVVDNFSGDEAGVVKKLGDKVGLELKRRTVREERVWCGLDASLLEAWQKKVSVG
jgi:hypothetical protein